jgi:hypothetical protein
MNKILYFLLASALMLAIVAQVSATDTVVTAAGTLTAQNSYATMAYWFNAPTGTDTKSIAYDSNYAYFVEINATSIGNVGPSLNIVDGTNKAAFRAGIGNLVIPLTANRTILVGPIESARFLNATKYFRFSTTNVTTATMAIFKVMR